MDIATIVTALIAVGGWLFTAYKDHKQLPAQEMTHQLKSAESSLNLATQAMENLGIENKRQGDEIKQLRADLKQTVLDFTDRNNELQSRVYIMFNLFELQLLALNGKPIIDREKLMTADISEMESLVDKIKQSANTITVTAKEQSRGENVYSKSLQLFYKDFYELKDKDEK